MLLCTHAVALWLSRVQAVCGMQQGRTGVSATPSHNNKLQRAAWLAINVCRHVLPAREAIVSTL